MDFWVPNYVGGKWPHWQCSTPSGIYNFQAASEQEAQIICDREKAACGASVRRPCRSPYCECDIGKCTHPGCYDARGTDSAPMGG